MSEHSNHKGDALPVPPANLSVNSGKNAVVVVETADKPSRREALLVATGAAAGSVLAGCGGTMSSSQCMGDPPSTALIVTPAEQAKLDADKVTQVGVTYAFVVKDAKGYLALDTRCQHAGCLTALATSKDGFICGCHGSTYALDGSVKNGPATKPLPVVSMCRRASDNALAIDLNVVLTSRDGRVT